MSNAKTEADMARVSDLEMKWDERPSDLVDWEAEERLGWWTRMWRAKWNLIPRGPKWLPEIIRMTWFLQVCGIVMGIHGGIDGEVGGPFFYSRTSCCGQSGTPRELPSHYDVQWPKTMIDYGVNVSHLKACDVPILNPDNSAWSHSFYCPNWDYVRAFTQKLNAGRHMSLTLTSLFFMPIGAGLADKRGRKPIFLFGHILGIKSITCNLLSSLPWFVHHDPNAVLLYVSSLLSGMASGSGPTYMAMMVDLIPGDMREQGFPILSLFHIPGQLIVFGIGYPLLAAHLQNYTGFWIISLSTDFICLAFFFFFLPESMPDKMKKPVDAWDFFPATYYWSAVKIVFKYPLLVGIVPSIAINSFASMGMMSVAGNQLWMGPLKFKQEQMLIPHLVRMGIGIPANLVAAVVIPRIGVWRAIFWGYGAHIAIGILADMWPIWCMNHFDCWGSTRCGDGSWGTDLFWAKWAGTITKEVIRPFVDAIYGPAQFAMISMQVSQTEQASIQSAFRLVSSLAGMYAPLFFTNYCFDVKWTSWRVITYAFVGYGLHAVATVLFFCAYMMDRYVMYHSRTSRVIANPRLVPTNAATAAGVVNQDYRRIDDYRREQNAKLGMNFDYRREFYARAEHNYRVAGYYGNGGYTDGAVPDGSSSSNNNSSSSGSRHPAVQSRDVQRQHAQRQQLSNNATGMRRGRRQQRQNHQQAQQQPLISPVRGTQNSDL